MQIRRDDLMQRKAGASRARLGPPVEIGPPGHVIAVNWAAALGATKAEVTQASATISPSSVIETHTDVSISQAQSNGGWIIEVPAKKRLSALTLHGFKEKDQDEIVSSPSDGKRITLAFPAQQGPDYDSPRFAVPALPTQPAVRPLLGGANFSNHVLNLDTPAEASKVLLSLVTGNSPAEFSTHATDLGSVDVTTETPATNAQLTGPGGTAVWQTPVFDPDGPDATVDLRALLEAALNQQLAKKQALQAAFTLSADAPAQVRLNLSGPSGALLRTEKGVIRTTLQGDPATLQLSGPLATETPASVVGDLTVRYQGVRILETISDSLPGPGDAISGAIVGTEGAVRTLPPQALDQQNPAKVGVHGRAPEDCELSVEFLRMIGPEAGEALAAPAVLQLKKSDRAASCWADVPKGTRIAGPVAVRVRANRGRFFWTNNRNGEGIVRIAIIDPVPAGRPLEINGARLLDVSASSMGQSGFTFPANCFHGEAPVFTSNLFLAVACEDLTLRYAR